MSMPCVSIGMPLYNAEPYVRRALTALLAQEFRDFELIISDNASTDSTLAICREFAAGDPRIRLLTNTENLGPQANFRRVLYAAQCDYFMFAAYDDCWPANYVGTLLENLEQSPDAMLSGSAVAWVYPDGSLMAEAEFPDVRGRSEMSAIRRMLRCRLQAGWFYGLHRTAALRPLFDRYWSSRFVWAADLLLLVELILNGRIVGNNRTKFHETITFQSAAHYRPATLWDNLRFARWFLSEVFRSLASARLPFWKKPLLVPSLLRYSLIILLHPLLPWLADRGLRLVRRVRRLGHRRRLESTAAVPRVSGEE